MTTGSVLAQFTITLSKAVSEQVAVEWHTEDGSALAGVDYAAAKGTVLFAPGQTAKTVEILVHGRAVGSEDRSFFVEMLPPTNAILGASVGECIIHVDTTGSTPVTQIIVPTGPQGQQGDSAYQAWLDLGNTGTEQDFIDSLKPSAEEIAEEVAPILNVSNSPLTAEGTETLSKPDTMTGKRLARRVAYVGAAKVATVVLADGDNLITHAALSGDAVDFNSISLYPRILRGTVVISPEWSIEPGDKILIKSAVAGDVLHVCQYDVISERAVRNLVEHLVAPVGYQAFEALRRSYADAGYNVVGTFRVGFTIVNANDVGIDEATGKGFTGPVGDVPAGTDPVSGGFVDVSTAGLNPMLYVDIRSYRGAAKEIRCIGKDNVFDGRYGLFVRADSDTTSADDGVMVLVDANGRRWRRQHAGPLLPRFAGVVGDDVVDDYAACVALITAFKKRGIAAPGGTDMRGDGIDWTGYKCRLSQKLDLTGLFNYNFTNPTFAAHSSFSGTALLKIDSDHTYLVSGITWINPQLDGAWLADYCVEAYDFLKWSLIGGKFTHYKKKGFITGTVNDAPHEVNVSGTFFFQREYNETYPPSVTEGEAWELNNYDNEFSNVVVGYHKQWAFTNNKGANRFVGGHIYTGWNSDPLVGGVRSLDNGDDFIGTYFDNTWIKPNARTSYNGCSFLVGTAAGAIAASLDTDPYQVKITDCRFKKLGANTQVIAMPTVAAGRTSRPDIYDNEYENCSGITTRGPWFSGLNVSSLVIQVPDQFLPLGNFSMPGRAASATGSLADRICGASYDASTNSMTINTYKIMPDGTLTPSVLNGSMVMNMNV